MVISTSPFSPGGGTIVVLCGSGDGTFGSGDEFPIGTVFSGYFALSDLDGDAKPEAIVRDSIDSLWFLLNIAPPPEIADPFSAEHFVAGATSRGGCR
jgi:hypothetical protein